MDVLNRKKTLKEKPKKMRTISFNESQLLKLNNYKK